MKTIPLLLHLTTPSALLDQHARSRVLAYGRRSWLRFRRHQLLRRIDFQIAPSRQQSKSSKLDLLEVRLDELRQAASVAVHHTHLEERAKRPGGLLLARGYEQ